MISQFLALISLFTLEIYGISCPNGSFSSFSGTKCYFIPDDSEEYMVAQGGCQQQNGILASVSNAYDNYALTSKKTSFLFLLLIFISRKLTF